VTSLLISSIILSRYYSFSSIHITTTSNSLGQLKQAYLTLDQFYYIQN
jgi:hypothetical protein